MQPQAACFGLRSSRLDGLRVCIYRLSPALLAFGDNTLVNRARSSGKLNCLVQLAASRHDVYWPSRTKQGVHEKGRRKPKDAPKDAPKLFGPAWLGRLAAWPLGRLAMAPSLPGEVLQPVLEFLGSSLSAAVPCCNGTSQAASQGQS